MTTPYVTSIVATLGERERERAPAEPPAGQRLRSNLLPPNEDPMAGSLTTARPRPPRARTRQLARNHRTRGRGRRRLTAGLEEARC